MSPLPPPLSLSLPRETDGCSLCADRQAAAEEHAAALSTARDEAHASASSTHHDELASLRASSEAAVAELRTAHAAEVDALRLAAESAAASAQQTRDADVRAVQLELAATEADLARARSAAESLEEGIRAREEALDEARKALAAAEERATAAAAAAASQPQSTSGPDVAALEARLSELEQERDDATQALRDTQEGLASQLDSMDKLHQQELESAKEDHVNSLGLRSREHDDALRALQDKLVAVEEDRQRLRQELVDSQQKARRESLGPAPGAVTDVDVKALHAAHQAKLAEVEASLQAEVEQLREVRPFSSSRLSRSRASC